MSAAAFYLRAPAASLRGVGAGCVGQHHVEVELAFLQIGALDADAHGIAQRESAGRRAARHGVFRPDRSRRNRRACRAWPQPFDVVLVDLDEDALLGDARYVGDPPRRFCVLPPLLFYRGAFRPRRRSLRFKGVLAQRFECHSCRSSCRPFEVACQQAVHHHVGIAADRRSEVGVVREEASPKWPMLSMVCGSFGHQTISQRRDDVLFRGDP